jgi:hypothetical protein
MSPGEMGHAGMIGERWLEPSMTVRGDLHMAMVHCTFEVFGRKCDIVCNAASVFQMEAVGICSFRLAAKVLVTLRGDGEIRVHCKSALPNSAAK